MTNGDYLDLLHTYASSQFIADADGVRVPFIDENLDPFTGEWLARKILHSITPPRNDVDRGKDYNHSSFCDLVISGLAGIRAAETDVLTIEPLFTKDQLEYFCADGILYHGHTLTVLWDKDGSRYGRGTGLFVMLDGETVATADTVAKLTVSLKE